MCIIVFMKNTKYIMVGRDTKEIVGVLLVPYDTLIL